MYDFKIIYDNFEEKDIDEDENENEIENEEENFKEEYSSISN